MSRSTLIAPVYPNRDGQDVANHRAVAAVTDVAESSLGIADNFASYAEGRLPALGEQGEQLLAAVRALYTSYKFERPAGWDEARLLAECGQSVTPAQMDAIFSRPTLDGESVAMALRELEQPGLARGRYLVMRDNLTALRPHRGAATEIDVAAALTALHDIQHVDPTEVVKDELSEMDVPRRACAEQLREAQEVYDTAKVGGDVVAVERAHRHLIAAHYEYVVANARPLHFLAATDGSEDDGARFSDRLERIRQEAQDGVKGFRDDKRALRDAFEADMAKCAEAAEQEAAHHDAESRTYAERTATMEEALAALVQRKVVLVDEIQRKAAELREVMEEQRALTQEVVQTVKAEAQRVTAHAEFVDLAAQHRERLQRCLEYCASCAPVVEHMEDYVAEMVRKLPRDVSQEAMCDIIDHETDAFMKAYRAFVFSCGDLTVRKTHRLDTLERQARLAQHNRDSAMDSLDPNYESYRAELAEVLAQTQAVEGVIHALHATQDAGEQVFESVEDVVMASCARSGAPFVHPLQEFGHASVVARTQFVDRSTKYVEQEEQQVNMKRAQLQEAKLLVCKDQQALERAVAAAAGAAGAAAIAAPPEADAASTPAAAPSQIEL